MSALAPKSEAVKRRQRYLQRWTSLRAERDSWLPHWRELSEHIRPRGYRHLQSDRNKGDKKNDKIINSTPIRGARVLTAGMMASVTSPSRRWFHLTVSDRELNELASVKEYLSQVEEEIAKAIAKSNLYKCFHHLYWDLVPFGTSCLLIEEDDEDDIRGYHFPLGSYCLANSARMAVDTIYRETSMTVGQLVEMFGLEACSAQVRQAHQEGHVDQAHVVMHVIEPNRSYMPGALGPRGFRFSSCWFELNCQEGDARFLRESGYEEQPFIAPRWQTTGDDVYGSSCPGMEALGDCKALQEAEKEKAVAIDKVVTPPMQGPSTLTGDQISLLPGGFTQVDGTTPQQTLRPAVEVNPSAVSTIGVEIREHENRIMALFYADLWLGITRSDEQMTATEVNARREEQLMQLGPVNENLQNEGLDPVITRIYAILERKGRLPPPPEEIQGQPLKIEYISVMAQAQKLVGVASIERLVAFVANLAGVKPEVLDKMDLDQAVDELADAFGAPPGIVRSDDLVEGIRQRRAQMQQQAQQLEAAQQLATTAKTLGQTPTDGETGLTAIMRNAGVR